jgi:hypothetical protein
MQSRIQELLNFLRPLGWWGALAVSLALVAGSIVLAVVMVVRWPVGKFKGSDVPPFWVGRHPIVRIAGLAVKNLIGYLIVLLGIAMAIPGVPGQGLLLILIGMTLVDFPGKRRVERRLIAIPSVLRVVNLLRKRFGHTGLEID